jgi:hypothetical protein
LTGKPLSRVQREPPDRIQRVAEGGEGLHDIWGKREQAEHLSDSRPRHPESTGEIGPRGALTRYKLAVPF